LVAFRGVQRKKKLHDCIHVNWAL